MTYHHYNVYFIMSLIFFCCIMKIAPPLHPILLGLGGGGAHSPATPSKSIPATLYLQISKFKIFKKQAKFLDIFGRSIYTRPDTKITVVQICYYACRFLPSDWSVYGRYCSCFLMHNFHLNLSGVKTINIRVRWKNFLTDILHIKNLISIMCIYCEKNICYKKD